MLSDFLVFPILLSTDLEATRAFYQDVLGWRSSGGRGATDRVPLGWRDAAGGDEEPTGTTDIQTQIAWRVPDIHAAVAELRARGVRIEAYVAPDPVTDADGIADMGHSWAAWFIDPSRNCLAVVQPKAYGLPRRPDRGAS